MKILLNFTIESLRTTGSKILILVAIILSPTIHISAQTPIDVTDQHAKIGRTFVDEVWTTTKTGTVTLPKKMDLPIGAKGEQIRIKYSDPISKWTFRSAVNKVVDTYSDITNAAGGWSDEDENIITLLTLNAGNYQNRQRAGCLVLYNENTGTAVFFITSTQL
ncbi:MAG: hypothetical protein CL666_10460 [Balneola sp.]|nr:hypothetical protein [Balneola sp.]|tara:strand:+ start:26508 stop:26996 length:489 start_codon:yes stop_codon:yes gene_type:complete